MSNVKCTYSWKDLVLLLTKHSSTPSSFPRTAESVSVIVASPET